MCPFWPCLCLISVRTEMIICCHQELFTQYPQQSMCVQKVQKVAVPIKRVQDISAGWSVLCSRDQRRSLSVKCVTFLSSNQSLSCQARILFSHRDSDFKERLWVKQMLHICDATGLNANSREALTFIQFKCHSFLSWYSPTIILKDIIFLTLLGSGAKERFYTFCSGRFHTHCTALVIYLYSHTGRHQNKAQGLCWVK